MIVSEYNYYVVWACLGCARV